MAKKQAGGDSLRGVSSNVRGSTDGKQAQSVVSAKQTTYRRKSRVFAATYILPTEVRDGWKVMHVDKRGHIVRVDY